jgi:hypothetical protein
MTVVHVQADTTTAMNDTLFLPEFEKLLRDGKCGWRHDLEFTGLL